MRRQQRLLGARDVSLVQSDPSELVQRPPQLASQIGAQLLAGLERLMFRLGAGPAEPEDLGAVDPAAPVEAPDGIGLGPPLHRLGPFLGHVIVRQALQGAHQLAVDDPRREPIQVPGDRRHPGLVEQRQALGDIAVQDAQPCLRDLSDGARRRVTPRTDLDGTLGPRPSAGQVARQHPLIGADDRQPRLRRRLTLRFQQPLRTCQPAPHRCHERGVEQQVHRHPDSRSCRRDLITGLQGRGVGARPGLDGHLELAGRIRDLAKHR
jgi:hypothetical protein